MNLLRFFAPAPPSARIARERLQILLAHERASAGRADLLAILQKEILAAIARHIPVDRDKVAVRIGCEDDVTTLAIDVEVPQGALAAH
jgi:cell division topological specificity factor